MGIAKVQSQAEAREAIEQQVELRKRAARQAAAQIDNPVEVAVVNVRVLPLGDGKISMGVHIGGVGEAFYEKGEIIQAMPEPRAQALEGVGYVEIVAAKAAAR
jgi:hypothetical protein